MCGRFVSTQTPDQIAQYFDAVTTDVALGENFNVAPTHDVYAVVEGGDGERHVQTFQWGLVPHWAKDTKIGSTMINARAETVADKPAFKSVFVAKRCIIPMDGFYEWATPTGPDVPLNAKGKPLKQPTFIRREDGEPLAVAGLWTAWRDKTAGDDAPWLHTCSVITTAANATMAPIHDRMPVILPPDAWEEWLSSAQRDATALQRLLVPAPDTLLTTYKVGTDVNRVANNDSHLIDPV